MKTVFLLLTLVSITACNNYSKEELIGSYAPIGYTNTFDTIQLKSEFVYIHKVYDQNKKLVLKNEGKWTLKNNNQIKFDNFFLNLDRNLIQFPELLNDTDFTITTNLETINNKIGFCVGYYDKENCYFKTD